MVSGFFRYPIMGIRSANICSDMPSINYHFFCKNSLAITALKWGGGGGIRGVGE